MNLLLDANLSWRMTHILSNYFINVKHVENIDIEQPAKDIHIWQWAKNNNFSIITNDDDFLNLAFHNGFPPKIIILKTGNQSREFIITLLINKQFEIEAFLNNENYGVLEIY